MDFNLSPDQDLLRESARSMLAKECPISLVRAQWEGDTVASDELWSNLREWVALAGTDGGRQQTVELCLFLEETGAVLAPGAYFPTAALFAPLLAATGNELLAPVLAGDLTGTVAVAGAKGAWEPNEEPVKCFVPEAQRVDRVAAVVPRDGTSPEEALEVRLYEAPETEPMTTMDPSRRMACVNVAESPLAAPPVTIDRATFDSILERAAVCLAAEMMGVIRWIFDTTLDYAKSREQFDRPIGSFQAIKHKLADMALVRDEAWSAVYWAAMAIDAEDEARHLAAHSAKIVAGEAAKRNAKDGMQIHGGIGYTYDYDLHLYLRRAYASEFVLGTGEWHRDKLAKLVLD